MFQYLIAIHGGWSDWNNDTECIEHGNDGIWMQQISRNCTNPEPAYGGIYCLLANGNLQLGVYIL